MIYNNPEEMRQSVREWKKAYELIILLVLLMCLALVPWAGAQTIERQVINSFGGSTTSPNMEHSAGEAVIMTRSKGSVMLTQGFHQSYGDGFVSTQEFVIDHFGISIYPNPASTTVNIAFSKASKSSSGLQLIVYNSGGQLVFRDSDILKSPTEVYQLNISALSCGIYYVQLSNGTFQSNHKIIKTN